MSYVDPASQGTPQEGVPISHQWGDDVQGDVEILNTQVTTNTAGIAANTTAINTERTRAVSAEDAITASLPAAASTVTGPDAFGASAHVGTSTAYARQDHDHGLPTPPSAATTVTGPDAVGTAPAVGTSLLYARADHDHGLSAGTNPAYTTVSVTTGVAFIPNATYDCMIYFALSGVDPWVLTFGPSTGAEIGAGNGYGQYGLPSARIPKGWKAILTYSGMIAACTQVPIH